MFDRKKMSTKLKTFAKIYSIIKSVIFSHSNSSKAKKRTTSFAYSYLQSGNEEEKFRGTQDCAKR